MQKVTPIRVLYVEDNPYDSDLAVHMMRKIAPHITIDIATSLAQARTRLEGDASSYDVLLTDVQLPDGTGLQLLSEIRASRKPIAVVVISGAGDEETVVIALRAGADDYVVKRGDCFERLPRVLHDALHHFKRNIERQTRPLHVLYAEHDAADIDLTRRYFAKHSPYLQFETASTAEQTLARLKEPRALSHFDVILLDYRLPGMTGLELLQELRQGCEIDLPVIILTGKGDEIAAIQAFKLGASDYLVKTTDYFLRLPSAIENAYIRAQLIREQNALRASERRFRMLVEQSPFAIQVYAPGRDILQSNAAWRRLWSHGKTLPSLASGDAEFEKALQPYLDRGLNGATLETPPIVNTGVDASGAKSERWVRTYIYPLRDKESEAREVVVMQEDVSEKKKIEDAVRALAAGISTATSAGFFQDLVWHLADFYGAQFAYVAVKGQDSAETLTTVALYRQGRLIDNVTRSAFTGIHAEVLRRGRYVCSRGVRERYPDEELLRDLDAESFIGIALVDSKGRALGVLAVGKSTAIADDEPFIDLLNLFAARATAEIQRLHAEERIYQMAFHDYLTGLPNRAKLHAVLADAVAGAKHTGQYGAVALFDLDHFKTVNDALGHEVGDLLLREVARQVEQLVAGKAFAARMGGDEFIVVMQNLGMDEAQAKTAAREFGATLCERLSVPLAIGDRRFNVGASVGVAVFPSQADSVLDLLRCVDMALYRAKEMGRNNVQLFVPAMLTSARERLFLEKGLRDAISEGQLVLHFQAQCDDGGEIKGAEALLRWHHPERGMVLPDAFIPVAEESGLIHLLGEWVLTRACRHLKEWADGGVPFTGHLAINVSPWQLSHPNFIELLQHAVAANDIDPSRIMIEITESALLADRRETVYKLSRLRSLGMKTSLDDFGTGYSSLSYLKDLPLDELKIDQSFVKELGPDTSSTLVKTIIAVGHHLGLSVIAEGVETADQLGILRKLGCNAFQGYFYSRPLAESDFLDRLRAPSAA